MPASACSIFCTECLRIASTAKYCVRYVHEHENAYMVKHLLSWRVRQSCMLSRTNTLLASTVKHRTWVHDKD